LEPIMGDGLIPADPKIWKVRSVVYSFTVLLMIALRLTRFCLC
jgi:hypothetical protein